MMVPTKQCTKCKNFLPLSEFYNDKSTKNGLTCWCKSCQKNKNKIYQKLDYKPKKRRLAPYNQHILKDGIELRMCTKCKEYKPLSEYWKTKKSGDGYDWRCKSCKREISRIWFAKNPSHRSHTHINYRIRIRDKAYNVLSNGENPKCQICGFNDDMRLLHIDHINKDGNKERKEMSNGVKNLDVTDRLRKKIINMDPIEARKKYRLLCVLHNWTHRLNIDGKKYKVVCAE